MQITRDEIERKLEFLNEILAPNGWRVEFCPRYDYYAFDMAKTNSPSVQG